MLSVGFALRLGTVFFVRPPSRGTACKKLHLFRQSFPFLGSFARSAPSLYISAPLRLVCAAIAVVCSVWNSSELYWRVFWLDKAHTILHQVQVPAQSTELALISFEGYCYCNAKGCANIIFSAAYLAACFVHGMHIMVYLHIFHPVSPDIYRPS